MEPAPLIDCALMVILFVNDAENGRHPKPFRDLLTSTDLEIAFVAAEAHSSIDLGIVLDRIVSTLARRNMFAICELIEVAQAVNQLRQSKAIKLLISNKVLIHLRRTVQSLAGQKCKYNKLLDRTEQEAQLRA
jgi:hypothetical protein